MADKIKIFVNWDSVEADSPSDGFLRDYSGSGQPLATGWWLDGYMEGNARDTNGNRYLVYWRFLDDYDPEEDDGSDACDWNHPIMILDEDNCNVLDDVTIIR